MNSIRSLWIWIALATLIVVWYPVLAVVRLFDRDPVRYQTGYWFRRLGRLLTRVNPAWQIAVDGAGGIDPRHPYVVVCNHQSLADIPVISRLPWEMKWVAKQELFRIPFVGWMMRLAGDIPVNREDRRSGAAALIKARAVLQQQCSVMFFPEGTRSRDGRVGAFNEGPFLLAIRSGVPLLPLVIDGTSDALPKNTWRFGPTSHVRLRVLDPISTDGLSARDAAVLRERVRAQLVETIAAWRNAPPETVDALALPSASR